MRKIFFLFLIISNSTFALQDNTLALGKTTLKEVKMKKYNNDNDASAVVLFEEGNTHHDTKNNSLSFITDYYFRIKIFKKEAFDKATIKIPFYKEEEVINISGITYNFTEVGAVKKSNFKKDNKFIRDGNNNWSEVSFTLPNVQEGSVIEYKYSVRSPYLGLIRDWYFQSNIPKIKSKYSSTIFGNWRYNVRLQGFLDLDVNESKIKKNCANIHGYKEANCENRTYEMNNIPAFEEEKYMSSSKNFKSRIIYDLISRTTYTKKQYVNSYNSNQKGVKNVEKFTKSWEDADQTIKSDFFDNKISEERFFKRQLPKIILDENNSLKRAKLTYKFIQNHFNWNSKYITYNKNLRKTFDEKVGSVDEINLSLYNSLQAVNIESYPVVLSTRQNGFPTDLFPIVDDFNYIIVKTVIDGKDYFLDATNKFLAFGQVNFNCLNGKVRVMDFNKGSFWDGIAIRDVFGTSTKLNLTLTPSNKFVGQMSVTSKGYNASNKRELFSTTKKELYLEKLETENPYLEILNYKRINEKYLEKPLQEDFEVIYDDDSKTQKFIRISPFFDERILANPFKLTDRQYPVDFGSTTNYSYLLKLKIPANYQIVSIPEEAKITLPNKGGSFILKARKKDGEVDVFMRYALGKAIYTSEEYKDLKEFFNQIIKTQKSYIEIKNKN